jgi:hypothetical protein
MSPVEEEHQANGGSLSEREGVSRAVDEQHMNGYSLPGYAHAADSDGATTRRNGFHTNGHAALNGSTNSSDGEFTKSQRAALNAMIGFARLVEPTTEPLPVVRADAAQSVSEASPVANTSSSASAAGVVAQRPPSDSLAPSHGRTGNGSWPFPPLAESERLAEPDAAALLLGEPLAHVPLASKTRSERRKAAAELPSARPQSGLAGGRWPLVPVLAVQAALSLRMVWNHTASTDEALYLWSGHLEWLHVLHGLPLPPFPTYFSGAPVVYPPLAALANAIGGLAAARILSLGFMLTATVLLWATTSLLFDRTAAFFSAGLWAVLGPTQFLGSYATYDAMSLCLLAFATWCAAHARRDRLMARWLIAAAAAITLANAAKYASMLFDPVVALVALLAVWPERGTWWVQHKRAAKHAALHLAIVLVIAADFDIMAMFLGGGWYETGIDQTTFSRVPGDSSARIVLICSGIWVGAVIVAALVGVAVCVTRDRRPPGRLLLLVVLASAALLAPAEQARIDTLTSLDKHVDFGAWFAAIAAGYGISRLIGLLRSPAGRAIACVGAAAALTVPAVTGVAQANQIFGQYGNSSALVAMLRPLVKANRGRILMDYGSVPEYYLGVRDWQQWSSTSSLRLPSGRTVSSPVGTTGNPALYQEYVRRGYFSLIILAFNSQGSMNGSIIATINEIPAYHFAGETWYGSQKYGAWVYDPGARS